MAPFRDVEDGRGSSSNPSGGIVIHVEPLQAAFFAGETFSAKITFTNTHLPSTLSSATQHPQTAIPDRPATTTGVVFKHKRGAHSIAYGSAPLANPPTSPGTPNYLSQFSMSTSNLHGPATAKPTSGTNAIGPTITRKGLIGAGGISKAKSTLPPDVNERMRAVSKRSLSVDVSPVLSRAAGGSPMLRDESRFGSPRIHPPSPLSRSRVPSASSDAGSNTVTPNSRNPTAAIPKSHPHARKMSVMDGSMSDQGFTPNGLTSSASYPPSGPSSSSSSSVPQTPSSANPFLSSLDPITEAPTIAVTNGTPPASEGPMSARERASSTPGPISSVGAVLYSPKPTRPHESNEILNGSRARGGSHSGHPVPNIGLGKPSVSSKLTLQSDAQPGPTEAAPNANAKSVPPRAAFSSSFAPPNTEVLLWSYAQLVGTVELDESNGMVSPDGMAGLRSQLNALRSDRVIGGGRMDIGAPVTPSPLTGGGSRTRRGLISSFLSVGMGGGSTGPSPVSPGGALGFGLTAISSFWSTPAPSPIASGFGARSASAAVASPMAGVSGGLPETALPTFETQPSMLAIDLNLGPGESRTYTYSLPLPAVLPPTFRGKAMKFSYHLVIGSSRAPSSSHNLTPHFGGDNAPQSKIMRVPSLTTMGLNIAVERPPSSYDLLWPLTRRKAGPVKSTVSEDQSLVPLKPFGPGSVKRPTPRGNALQFEEYANRLLILSHREERQHQPHLDAEEDSRSIANTVREHGERTAGPLMSPLATLGDPEEEMGGALSGCRENVEILTRVSRKMSYDISKDGVKVAVLTFVKTAFRLGETVTGVVEFNGLQTRGRVLKFSAVLETQEMLPPHLAEPSSQVRSRALKRVHAEHHSAMVIDCLRAPFMLDIPSDASPGFRVAVDPSGDPRHQGTGGLEWRVRMCFLVAVGSPPTPSDNGFVKASTRHLIRDGPIGDWGSSWKATPTLAPLTVGDGAGVAINSHPYYRTAAGSSSSWSFFSSSRNLDHQRDMEGWTECVAETVECEIGITVWPGNTLYRPTPLDFEV
ncbi:hypothetical protein FRC04_005842 [Tulasnella sp. 424]|nr:hypothetical protein FRC04_005842 [Tulasnella sp. 424]